jgi:hypothetical protein
MQEPKKSKVVSLKRPLMPECNGCIWYEREERNPECLNRKKIICKLYIEK